MIFTINTLIVIVRKLDQSLYFYSEILGFEIHWAKNPSGEGPDCASIGLGLQKILFQTYGQSFRPMPRMILPGTLSIGLKTETPLEIVRQKIADKGWVVLMEQAKKNAPNGTPGIYLRDPDENIIKITNSFK